MQGTHILKSVFNLVNVLVTLILLESNLENGDCGCTRSKEMS